MSNPNSLLVNAFVFGMLVSMLSVLAERLLIFWGFTRGNTIGLIIGVFISSIIKQLVIPNGSPIMYGLMLIFIGVLAGNRSDLTQTCRKGRWWWKLENNNIDFSKERK